MVVSSFINLKTRRALTDGFGILSIGASAIALLFAVCIPIKMAWNLHITFANESKEELRRRFPLLLEGMKYERRSELWYYPLWFFRLFTFGFGIVVIEKDMKWLSVTIICIVNAIMLIYHMAVRPFESDKANLVAILIELATVVFSGTLISFLHSYKTDGFGQFFIYTTCGVIALVTLIDLVHGILSIWIRCTDKKKKKKIENYGITEQEND